ncbi:MAG: hypothetical protein AB7T59_07660 [Hyphomonadaceae bacterium]
MARPRTPLLKRIASKLPGVDLDAFINAKAPIVCDLSKPCWEWQGAKHQMIRIDGPPTPVVRTLTELATGKLHHAWVMRRQCANRQCVNPAHHEPFPYNQNRYGWVMPLPARLAHYLEKHVDHLEELTCTLASLDPRPPTPEAFQDYAKMMRLHYDLDLIREAYSRLT